jgi:hypothetical protein
MLYDLFVEFNSRKIAMTNLYLIEANQLGVWTYWNNKDNNRFIQIGLLPKGLGCSM